MSRHLMTRFRRQATGEDGWQKAILPHTARDADHFEARHGGSGSLPIQPEQFHTKLVNHGETRYGLQVMDSSDGWLEWSLHRQTGPDITNPDHWERLGVSPEINQFCHCIGDCDDEADLEFPAGSEDGYAGYTNGGATTEEGIESAKADADKAFHDKIGGQGHGLDHHNYDDLARGLDEPDGGYDIFGGV